MINRHQFTKEEQSQGGRAAIRSLAAQGKSLADFRKDVSPEQESLRGQRISARRRIEVATRALLNLFPVGGDHA